MNQSPEFPVMPSKQFDRHSLRIVSLYVSKGHGRDYETASLAA